MYRYGFALCSSLCLRPQAISVLFFALQRQSVPGTKRQATKCPRDETAGEELRPRQNGWRRSVSSENMLATKCASDETAETKRQQRTVQLRAGVPSFKILGIGEIIGF